MDLKVVSQWAKDHHKRHESLQSPDSFLEKFAMMAHDDYGLTNTDASKSFCFGK
jgi:hypothetical protein